VLRYAQKHMAVALAATRHSLVFKLIAGLLWSYKGGGLGGQSIGHCSHMCYSNILTLIKRLLTARSICCISCYADEVGCYVDITTAAAF
jgi:hypothetical protein